MSVETPLFDLHVHSVASDGLRSPLELACMARRAGLAGLALTDHDVLPDPRTQERLSGQTGVLFLAGVELSTEWYGRDFHLLGYGVDPEHAPLARACRELRRERRRRLLRLAERLSRGGIRWEKGRIEDLAGGGSPGRMHLARELVRMGHAGSPKAAFRRYLTALTEEAHARTRLPLAEAVGFVHAAGGKAVLAHPPVGLTREDWGRLVDLGLDGIETRHPRLKAGHRRFLVERTREFGLAATAGSDYHGDERGVELGAETTPLETVREFYGAKGVALARTTSRSADNSSVGP